MFDLIKNDWEKIPQNIRYIIEVGIALMFNAWILDHWLPNQTLPYKYLWYFDLRSLCYNLGQSFVFLAIILIIIKQLLNLPKLIFNYKSKYHIKNLGKTFDLVWFSGKLILFDYKEKKYYHVYPWETAQDLNFVSYGTHVEDHFPNPQNPKIEISKSKILDTTKYKNGGSINTRQ
jgi:hypothetical protein